MKKINIEHLKYLIRITLSVGSLLILLGLFILKQYNLLVLSLYLIIPIILVSLLTYFIKGKNRILNYSLLNENIFLILNLSLLSIGIIIINIFEIRSILFFIIFTMYCVLIFIQIKNRSSYIKILFQIISGFILFDLSLTLKYYYYIGNTDVFDHFWWIKQLFSSGYVSNFMGIYAEFPLWHIFYSMIYNLTGISINNYKLIYLINCLILSFSIIIFFLLIKKITKNTELSLIAAFFLSLNPDFLFYATYSIPRSITPFFELLMIYLLYKRNNPLAILISIVTIIYHTISMPFILVIFGLIYIVNKLFIKKEDLLINFKFILFSTISMLIYYFYISKVLLQDILGNIVFPASAEILTQSIFITPFNELLNYIMYSFLIFFILYGFLSNTQKNEYLSLIQIISLIIIPLSFPGPLLLLTKLSQNFNILRFSEYTTIFISLAVALGLLSFEKIFKKKYIIPIILCVMIFLTVTDDFVSSDNPLFKRTYYSPYLTQNEISTLKSVTQFSQGKLYSDFIVWRLSPFSDFLNSIDVIILNSNNTLGDTNGTYIIRYNELLKRGLKVYINEEGSNNPIYLDTNSILNKFMSYNKISDSYEISTYKK